jgi:hypothetical protein
VLLRLPEAEHLVEALTTWLIMAVNYWRNRRLSIEQVVHQMGPFYDGRAFCCLLPGQRLHALPLDQLVEVLTRWPKPVNYERLTA